jgi:hypothetical protein
VKGPGALRVRVSLGLKPVFGKLLGTWHPKNLPGFVLGIAVDETGGYDDALAMKPGSEDIALTLPRFLSGTDNYLCFDDWGERLVVLRLRYHAAAAAVPGPAGD